MIPKIKTGIIPTDEAYNTGNALIQNGYIAKREAWHRGYVSRKTAGRIEPYNGKYGKGYTWDKPAWSTSQYIIREYWLKA